MGMRKALLTICCILCSTALLEAQRYPFENTEDFTADTVQLSDCTYIVDRLLDFQVNIYNVVNHPGRDFPVWANDGTVADIENRSVVHNSYSKKILLDEIITNELGEYVNMLQGETIYITLNISAQSGIITDVYFSYLPSPENPIAKIPIEQFRAIELRIKRELAFEPTEIGAALDYIFLGCAFEVEEHTAEDQIPIGAPLPRPDDNSLSTEIP